MTVYMEEEEEREEGIEVCEKKGEERIDINK